MPKFVVTEVTEMRTVYEIEAKHAPSAIKKVKEKKFEESSRQSIETHHIAEQSKEEIIND